MPTSDRQTARRLIETFLRAAVIGLCGGLASIVFRGGAQEIQTLIGIGPNMIEGARLLPWWQKLLYPTVGAFGAWLMVRYLVRGQGGTGLSDVMEAVSVKRGPIGFRSAISRAAASLGIIVTGGSVGREGPIITISAAASSLLARVLRAPVRDRGMLLGCGVAAGFAAAYNAPIAGAIFALEIILGNFAIELLAPVVVASTMATLFTRHSLGESPIFALEEPFRLESIGEIVPYMMLGVAAGFAAVGFQKTLKHGDRFFRDLPLPRLAKMMLGGLLIGAIAIWFPEVWGNGYGAVREILDQSGPKLMHQRMLHTFLILMLLMLVKMIGTSITVGSGGAGGVFTPTLFVGAGLGGAFGALVHGIAPEYTASYGAYALVGMGGLVAGTTRAPIMAVLVIYEMTGDYQIVLPLMLVCITSSIVARSLYKESIYTEALAARGVTTPRGLEETVLVTTRVSDIMRNTPTWVSPATTYQEIVPLASAARVSVIYVCDDDHRLLGAIRLHDVIQLSQMADLGPTIVAADLMGPPLPVTPDEQLASAFEHYGGTDLDELPVVRDHESMRLEGVITRKDVMGALHHEVLKRQNLLAKFVRREDDEARTDYVELPEGHEVARVPVHPEHLDKSMGDAAIRARHQLTVLNVIRPDGEGGEMRILPSAGFVLHKDDALIVLGQAEAIESWRVQCGDR